METPVEGLEELASKFLLTVEEKSRQRAVEIVLRKTIEGRRTRFKGVKELGELY